MGAPTRDRINHVLLVVAVIAVVTSMAAATSSNQPNDPCDLQRPCVPDTVLPDPYNCNKYIQCVEGRRWVSRTCPNEHRFHQGLGYCVKEVDAPCHPGCPMEALPACYRSEPCTVNQLLPDPYNCSKFYQCGAGRQWVEKRCPPGQGFDRQLSVCQLVDQAICHPRCPLDPCNKPYPCPTPRRRLPDPENCATYYECTADGNWVRAFCELPKHFDETHSICASSYKCYPPCDGPTTGAPGPDVTRHVLQPPDSDALEGQPVLLRCVVTLTSAVSSAEVIWQLNNVPLSTHGARFTIDTVVRPTISSYVYYSKLFIRPAYWSDSGTLRCLFKSPGLQSTTHGELRVLGKPVVRLSLLTATRTQGDQLLLTCAASIPATSHPKSSVPATFIWYKDGQRIITGGSVTIGIVSKYESRLRVDSIVYSAVYACVAENEAGRSQLMGCKVTVVQKGASLCREESQSGIRWRQTAAGYSSQTPCSGVGKAVGEASRMCALDENGDAFWKMPNLNNCVDKSFQTILDQIERVNDGMMSDSPDTMINIANSLEVNTNNSLTDNDMINPGNLNASISAIRQLADMHSDRLPATDEEVISVVRIASNLLSEKNDNAWQSLLQDDNSRGVSVMATIDSYITHVAEILETRTGKKEFESTNLVVSIEQWSRQTGQSLSYPNQMLPGPGRWVRDTADRAWISRDSLDKIAKDLGRDEVVVSSSYYRTLDFVLPVKRSSSDVVASKILAVSVEDVARSARLSTPIQLFFDRYQPLNKTSEDKCSFWDYSQTPSGGWSTSGCRRTMSNETGTWCECDHMTNFAILVSQHHASEKDQFILSIISLIGCILSIAGMVLTVGIYILLWKMIQSDYALLLLNLCVALVIANVIFLVGVNRTEPEALCTVTAAFLHYFFLAAFFLMFAEAIELLLYVVYVFHVHSVQETIAFLLTAWGLPIVIVGISLGVTKAEGYGNKDFCWLSLDGGLIYAFLGPICLIILANIVILVVVVYNIMTSSKHRDKKGAERFKTSFWNLAVLGPLLGIGWIFGIFSVTEDTVAFQYIFAILNSFQGLFIFLFHCAFNTRVREALGDRCNPNIDWTTSFIGKKKHAQYRPTFGSKSNSGDTYSTSGSSTDHKRKDTVNSSPVDVYRRRESARPRGFTMVPDVPESPTASPTRKEVAGSFGSASIELHPGYSDHLPESFAAVCHVNPSQVPKEAKTLDLDPVKEVSVHGVALVNVDPGTPGLEELGVSIPERYGSYRA